jgi:hypothetical protein
MVISRIDVIGQNGNDGLHYLEVDILDRLERAPRINGSLMKDTQDAIDEIKRLRATLKNLYRESTEDGHHSST